MRTTLDIEDDVLAAAKELAQRERLSTGQIISRLARQALTGGPAPGRSGRSVGGFRPLPNRGVLVSNELVNKLREAEGV